MAACSRQFYVGHLSRDQILYCSNPIIAFSTFDDAKRAADERKRPFVIEFSETKKKNGATGPSRMRTLLANSGVEVAAA